MSPGWATVGLVLAATAPSRAPARPWARLVGLSSAVFFTVLAIANRLAGAAGAGTILVAIDLLLWQRTGWSGAPRQAGA